MQNNAQPQIQEQSISQDFLWLLPRVRQSRRSKTFLDMATCIAIVLPVLMVMTLISIAVLIDSGRPVFFVQERVGRGGRIFRMYKFRTLPSDYESSSDREYMKSFVRGEVPREGEPARKWIFKPVQKQQMTRVGRILRRTSLDELPQILNVVRREMSFIGPRPNVPWEVEEYQNWHKERLEVLPGITGLAQVRGRSSICFDDIVRHDIEYVHSRSLKLDLQILWWTVVSSLTGKGAH